MFRSALAVTSAAVILGALGMAAPAANAQQMTSTTSTGTVYFGGGLGLTIPIGSLSDGNNTGWHIQGMGGWESATTPWGFRGDLTYNSLGGKNINVPGVGATQFPKLNLLSLTADGVYQFRPSAQSGSSTIPYIIAGLGLYHLSFSDNGGSQTKFGINAGAGLEFRLTGFSVYAEGRFHDIFTSGKSGHYIPLTVGVKIGGK